MEPKQNLVKSKFKGYFISEPEGSEDVPKKKEKPKKVSIIGLFRFSTLGEKFLLVLGCICALAHGLAFPLFTVVLGDLIDGFNTITDFESIIRDLTLKFLYIGIGAMVAEMGQHILFGFVSERLVNRVREAYFRALLNQEVGWFDQQDSGEITARMTNDTIIVEEAVGDKFAALLQSTSTFIAGFVVGFVKGWQIALVMLAVTPLLAASAGAMMHIMTTITQKAQLRYAKAGAVANEVFLAIRTVAAFGGEPKELQRYTDQLDEAKVQGIKRSATGGTGFGVMMFLLYGVHGLALWYGSTLVASETMSGGEVLTAFLSVLIGAFALGNTGPFMEVIGRGQGAAYIIYETVDRKPEIDLSAGATPSHQVKGEISLSNVQFRYPTRPDVKVLKGLSLNVPVGKTTALVGPSGCGKSSIIQLVQRFYDPKKGSILLDGEDIQKYPVRWLRKQFGLVGQEPVLFSGTWWGVDEATQDEVEAAAKAANAHNFIISFPEGYKTQVGEKGAQLSGGQKQRIAIARALITNPKVLLLDEATSALDTESERVVQKALDSVMKSRTTIVIAHRLSTIRHADQIAVIHKGKVAELGTHEDLMAKDGIYASMVRGQQEAEGDSSQTQEEQSGQDGMTSSSTVDTKGSQLDPVLARAKETQKLTSLKRIFSLARPEYKYIALGSLFSMIAGAMNPCQAFFLSELLTIFYLPPDEVEDGAKWWAVGFLLLGLVPLIFMPLRSLCFGIVAQNLIKRLRALTFKSILRQDIGWFDLPENATGALTAKLATEATHVEQMVAIPLALGTQNISTIIVGVTIAMVYGWKLALVILACSPLLVFAHGVRMHLMKSFSRRVQKAISHANQIAVEVIGNMRTVYSFTAEDRQQAEYSRRLHAPMKRSNRNLLVRGIMSGLGEFFVFGTQALGFWYAGQLVMDGEITFGDLMKVFLAIIMAAQSVGTAAGFSTDATKGQQAATELFKIIDRESLIDPFSEEGKKPKGLKGKLSFNNVKFRYPSRPDSTVLAGLSLEAKPGTILALVGESGCGKSSSISLIERFYPVFGGSVKVDKYNVNDLNVKWLRQQMSLVGQEPVLLSGSIGENIAYGKPDATFEEVVEAAKSANAYNFISEFPNGFDTQVGEKGAQLSGGQKQRIAIARAIIRNPKILLLDEATSALDTESEKVVQEALDSVMQDRTTIVIAHRLSTIKNADQIAVIARGKVAEIGTHQELLEKQGMYYKMYTRQNN